MCLRKRTIASLVALFVVCQAAHAGGWRSGFFYRTQVCQRCCSKCALPYDDRETMVICNTRPVPPGWVIVGQWHAVACSGLGANAWKIVKLPDQPGSELLISPDQPIPPGWAILGEEKTIFSPSHRVIRIRKM